LDIPDALHPSQGTRLWLYKQDPFQVDSSTLNTGHEQSYLLTPAAAMVSEMDDLWASELVCGPLLLVAVESDCHKRPSCHTVFVKVHRTSLGQMLAIWNDQSGYRVLGCVYLRDTIVTPSASHKLSLCLRPKTSCDWQASLTLTCNSLQEFEHLERVLNHLQHSNHPRRKYTSRVDRMPSLQEE
jgi:hypothetical protein